MRIRRTVASQKPGPRKQRSTGNHWLLLFVLFRSAAFIGVWEATTASQISIEIDRLTCCGRVLHTASTACGGVVTQVR